MREFLQRYAFTWKSARDITDKIYDEFANNILELTPERILNNFINEKSTGCFEPSEVRFEDPDDFVGQGRSGHHLSMDNIFNRNVRSESTRSG